MEDAARVEQLDREARFVFKGTVLRLKASTMSMVPVTAKTAIVRVDQVVRAPEMLERYSGHEITVQLASRERVRPGQQVTFYANGWLFGESIAVQSLGHTAIADTVGPEALIAEAAAVSPHDALAERDMRERVETADVVVAGRVSAVRVVEEESEGPAVAALAVGAGDEAGSLPPVSEHDPLWHEAIIEVEALEKGDESKKSIVVRFPSSTDVRWHRAPKLEPGQEGVFLLHRPAEDDAASLAFGVEAPDVYMALDPGDIQPTQKLAQVRTAIQISSTTDR